MAGMGRVGWCIVLAGTLAGCTATRVVQRDGCWVRQTQKKPFGALQEEIGPCTSPETPWVEGDRLTRLVQECAARADRRWQSRALAAWSRGEPLPERLGKDDVLQECMNDSARAVVGDSEALKGENDVLRKQVAALASERDALRARDDRDRDEVLATSSRLVDHLGEAAKKAQQPAVATATARSEQLSDAPQAPPAPPAVTVVGSPPSPAPPVTIVNSAPAAPPVASPAPASAAAPPAGNAPRKVSAGAVEAPRKAEHPPRARRPASSAPDCASPGASPIPTARSTCPDR